MSQLWATSTFQLSPIIIFISALAQENISKMTISLFWSVYHWYVVIFYFYWGDVEFWKIYSIVKNWIFLNIFKEKNIGLSGLFLLYVFLTLLIIGDNCRVAIYFSFNIFQICYLATTNYQFSSFLFQIDYHCWNIETVFSVLNWGITDWYIWLPNYCWQRYINVYQLSFNIFIQHYIIIWNIDISYLFSWFLFLFFLNLLILLFCSFFLFRVVFFFARVVE